MAEDQDIVVFEREEEFSICLGEVLEAPSRRVRRVANYAELLTVLRKTNDLSVLICDLADDQVTENFLRELVHLPHFPRKTVFTSIYPETRRWPRLREYPAPYLFVAKPFRAQVMLSFLFPKFSTSETAL